MIDKLRKPGKPMELTLDSLYRAKEHIIDRLSRLSNHIDAHVISYSRIYAISLLCFVLVYQLLLPIIRGDTDMWYHLNGGRYFWENSTVPTTPFFSFIDPDRLWINYFWGFQAFIYKIHEWFGYQGLVIVRALLNVAILAVVFRFLFESFKEHRSLALFILLTTAFAVFLEGRGYQLRPHLVSYLMIPTFLYVLERRPKWTPLLPILTVIWVNIHGVEWVIGGLICGAYFLEHFIARRSDPEFKSDRGRLFPYWLLLCGAATLLNPYFIDILTAPFNTPKLITEFINEMRPLDPAALHTLTINDLKLAHAEGLTIISVFAVIALSNRLITRSVRISHLILFIAGTYLLTRGIRMAWEWAFLVLPLIACWSRRFRWQAQSPNSRIASFALTLLLAAMPFATIGDKIDLSRPYPFDKTGLPTEMTLFLENAGTKGNMLMPPTDAGYVQWRLNPEILVHSDMEYPPFNEFDFLEVSSAFASKEGLERVIDRYRIDYIFTPTAYPTPREVLEEHSEFIPVFFDEANVLYANSNTLPDFVEKYRIEVLNPHNVLDDSVDTEKALAELRTLTEKHPDLLQPHHALVRLLLKTENYEEALPVARIMAERFPEEPNSEFLLGIALENSDQCEDAIPHYEEAKTYADESTKRIINKHIGACHYVLKDFTSAFKALNGSVKPFSMNESIESLYQLAFTGLIEGDTHQARITLHAILLRAPKGKDNIRTQAEDLLAKTDRGEFDIGISDWLKQIMQ